MQATKFLIVLAAASSPAMGLAVPASCIEFVPAEAIPVGVFPSGASVIGFAPTGTASTLVAPTGDVSSGTSAAQSVSEEPAAPIEHTEPISEPKEGSSMASSIGSSILDAGASAAIGFLPQLVGEIFGSGSSGNDAQNSIALQGCIAKTQQCCNNVQGKSSDSSACNDNTVIAAFGTNSACAGDNDDPVAHATTACKTALGM